MLYCRQKLQTLRRLLGKLLLRNCWIQAALVAGLR